MATTPNYLQTYDGATWVATTTTAVTAPAGQIAGSPNQVLQANNTGGLTWVTSQPVNGPGLVWAAPNTYGQVNVGGTYYTTADTGQFTTVDLNNFDSFDFSISGGRKYFNGAAIYLQTPFKKITYNLVGKTYQCFIEQDFTDLAMTVNAVSILQEKSKRYGILAYDVSLNRLELCSVIPDNEANASLEELLDDKLNIKEDKTEYLASLYGREVPLINCKVISMSTISQTNGGKEPLVDMNLTFERDETCGILPKLHLSHLVFGNLLAPSKQEVAASMRKLNTEVYLVDKKGLDPIQKWFSPEYAYLSLKTPSVVKQYLREPITYTKEGLIDFLSKACIEGTQPAKFVEELLNVMSLDQRILNIEDRATVVIKSLIEQNID